MKAGFSPSLVSKCCHILALFRYSSSCSLNMCEGEQECICWPHSLTSVHSVYYWQWAHPCVHMMPYTVSNYWIEFTPLPNSIRSIILRNWHIIEHLPRCKEKPCIGLQKTKSLWEILTSTDCKNTLTMQDTHPAGYFKCGKYNSCAQPWQTNIIHINGFNQQFKSMTNYASKSSV